MVLWFRVYMGYVSVIQVLYIEIFRRCSYGSGLGEV